MFAVAVILCVVLANVNAHVSFMKRNEELPVTWNCTRSTPCAFEVYRQFTKVVYEYMETPCPCSNGTTCKRSYDRMSMSSYVHMCTMDTDESNSSVTEDNTD